MLAKAPLGDIMKTQLFFKVSKVEAFSQPAVQGQRLNVRVSIDMEIKTWELPPPQNAPLYWG